MKIVRFTVDGVTRVGALEGDAVVELPGVRDTQGASSRYEALMAPGE